MTPFRTVSAAFVLLATLSPPAFASGWTGWPEFYRSFAVEPPPVRETKVPGIHKVPDVTLKRGITGSPPKAETAPKPKSSLDAAPPAPAPAAGWDPQKKDRVVGKPSRDPAATMTAIALAESRGESRYHGLRLQQGRVALDDMPAPPPPASPALAPKAPVQVPGTGSPVSGPYKLDSTTHKTPANSGHTTTLKARRNAGQ
jgi:hypothetical protein